MKPAMLDSDILSLFFKNTSSVRSKVDSYVKEHGFVNMSIITYYEILNGLLYKDAQKQLQNFEEFVKENKVLALTMRSAEISANIRAELRRKGIDIGHSDTLIAGVALANGLQLVTNNTNHFKHIKGLEIANWTK